ncbi:hypothetical protein IM40_06645 [Candidatus Paracaedimonas acanthamoebae]|nr:hypothetical protein IM40_06645 [Candidatus Paracaedimonas acanthamoebae]
MYKNLFLAVLFEDKLKEKLAHNLRLEASLEEVIYAPKQNLHLTLGFIRNVAPQDRALLKNAFDAIQFISIFKGYAQTSVILGNSNSLCIRAGPFEKLSEIRIASQKLLLQNSHSKYDFNASFDYLPHIKIQSLRSYLPIERRTSLLEEFSRKCERRIEFTIMSLALMERQGEFYHIVKKYFLEDSPTTY